jgi:hypothetical protein
MVGAAADEFEDEHRAKPLIRLLRAFVFTDSSKWNEV